MLQLCLGMKGLMANNHLVTFEFTTMQREKQRLIYVLFGRLTAACYACCYKVVVFYVWTEVND